MTLKICITTFILVVLFSLFSTTAFYSKYEKAIIENENYYVSIGALGTSQYNDRTFFKTIIEGNPYEISIIFKTLEGKFSTVELVKAELILSDNSKITLQNNNAQKELNHSSTKQYSASYFFSGVNLPPKNIKIACTLLIRGNSDREEVNFEAELPWYHERRLSNVWFDAMDFEGLKF